MEHESLKPCPFCGSKNIEISQDHNCVSCKDCGAYRSGEWEDEVLAVHCWNSRNEARNDYYKFADGIETKFCPWCGDIPDIIESRVYGKKIYEIICNSCCGAGFIGEYESLEQALESWNARS